MNSRLLSTHFRRTLGPSQTKIGSRYFSVWPGLRSARRAFKQFWIPPEPIKYYFTPRYACLKWFTPLNLVRHSGQTPLVPSAEVILISRPLRLYVAWGRGLTCTTRSLPNSLRSMHIGILKQPLRKFQELNSSAMVTDTLCVPQALQKGLDR